MTTTHGPQEPPERPDGLAPLDMAAPPWWDAWEHWQTERDPRPAAFIEGDPRAHLGDDLAYELAVLAFGGGWERLLDELDRLGPISMQARVRRLAGELRAWKEQIRGR